MTGIKNTLEKESLNTTRESVNYVVTVQVIMEAPQKLKIELSYNLALTYDRRITIYTPTYM